MPGFNRTGPLGYGPRTGRGMGPCGRGFGRGFGRSFRAYTPVPLTKEQEVTELKAEKQTIEQELKEIETRLNELEKKR